MEMRALGRSGLAVSRLGLGLAALGRPGYININHGEDLNFEYDVAHMAGRAFEVLDAAWAAGVRYFDVARSYGRAEAFLGHWLADRAIPVDEVVVGSKWGYTYTADWQVQAEAHEVKEHSLDVLQRQIGESRAHLGDYLKLYQIHSATLESAVLDNEAVLDALAGLAAGGLVIGLSVSGPNQAATIRQAITVRRDGRPLFGVIQATWNVLEQGAGDALQTAAWAGLGVIVKEALANGRLTGRNDDPDFQLQRARLEQVALSRASSVDAVALAVALAQPWADVVLSGAATVAHLRSNVSALDLDGAALVEGATGVRLSALAEPSVDYWRRRGRLAWN